MWNKLTRKCHIWRLAPHDLSQLSSPYNYYALYFHPENQGDGGQLTEGRVEPGVAGFGSEGKSPLLGCSMEGPQAVLSLLQALRLFRKASRSTLG